MFGWLTNHGFRTLHREIEALRADLEQLQGQHRALRSTFYATRGSPKGPPAPPPGSRAEKDAILRDFIAKGSRHDDSTS